MGEEKEGLGMGRRRKEEEERLVLDRKTRNRDLSMFFYGNTNLYSFYGD